MTYFMLAPPQEGKAIADYTALIEMPDAPGDLRAKALFCRGVAYVTLSPPEMGKRIADYTALIEMPETPADLRARALLSRGVTYIMIAPPETDKEIADYTALIDMPDAPAHLRAEALLNRGSTYGELTPPETDKEIADYSAVIQMPDAPVDIGARAHGYLGMRYYEQGRWGESIASARRALELAPGELWFRANLGLALLRSRQTEAGIKEYQLFAESDPDLVYREQAAADLQNLMKGQPDLSGLSAALRLVTGE